jgi:prepilin-type N-terminal cleavage/methylation domain-containing protein
MERLTKNIGFSLTELIAVMLVLSILAFFTYFKWSSIPFGLNSQAELLAGDIRYTQSLSMTRGQRYNLSINTSGKSYTIANASGTIVKNSRNTNVTPLDQGVSFGVLQGITNKITFDTKGVPYADSSTTPLTSEVTIPLTVNGQTISVKLQPETGRVYIQ